MAVVKIDSSEKMVLNSRAKALVLPAAPGGFFNGNKHLEHLSSQLSERIRSPHHMMCRSFDFLICGLQKIGFQSDRGFEGGKFQRRSRHAKLMLVSSTAGSTSTPSLKRTIMEGLVAGAVAGVTVETALYPIDTIKTRLQVASSGGGINFKGLYSGLSGNLFGVIPASAIFIGVYEPVKQHLLKLLPENFSVGAHLSAGAAGGLAASLVRVPTEVVKQRMQTGQFATAVGAVQGILAREGTRGLFAGYGAFLLRDLPFDAIQFAMYEQLKIAARKTLKRDLKDSEMAVIGAAAGAATGAVTTPLDVLKTRLMVQGTAGRYKGVADCLSKICAEEGAGALFRGVGPRVLWIGIGGSIFFTVLEKTKSLMAEKREKTPQMAATETV